MTLPLDIAQLLRDFEAAKDEQRKFDGKADNRNQQLGLALANLRRSQGVGVREIAKRLGISAGYVSRLERGKHWWTADRVHQYVASTTGDTLGQTQTTCAGSG